MSYQKLIDRGIDLRGQVTGQIKTICPKCSSSRKKNSEPCLSVNIEEGTFKCWNGGCGWVGSSQYEIPKPREKAKNNAVFDFFSERGIRKETLEHFQIGESVEWLPQTREKTRVICYNYFLNGELVNIKFRSKNKDFKMVKGAQKVPYNLDATKGHDYICVVEGENDVLAFHQSGVLSTVSVPNGASEGTNNLTWLDDTYTWFEGKKIYLACDSDGPGLKLREDLARRFDSENVYIVEFPEGQKDGNDILKNFGDDALKSLFDNARPLPFPEIGTVDDYVITIDNIRENGYPKGDTIGYPKYDELITYSRAKLLVTTGIPGHGKSTFVDQTTVLLAESGWKFGIFSPESDETLKTIRLMEQYIGHPIHGLGDKDYKKALDFVRSQYCFYNTPQMSSFHVDHLLDLADKMIKRTGIDYLVLDPYSYIKTDANDSEAIGQTLIKIKTFARQMNVLVHVVSHPKKINKDSSGNFEPPKPYDISGSHHWFGVPDDIFCVYRDYKTGIVTVYVQKIKRWFDGELGEVEFRFDPKTGRYEEIKQSFTAKPEPF